MHCSSSSPEGHSSCPVLDFRRLSDQPDIILYAPRSFSGINEGIQPRFLLLDRRAYAILNV